MKHDLWLPTQPMALDTDMTDAVRSPLLDATVMMVDDEPMMTDLIQAHLEEAGYTRFVVTNDPREALPMLLREQPGVLLLDLLMPHLSGFEVLKEMRTHRELRYTPVIVLTAANSAEAKLSALRLGVTEFLAKPVDASELVLRVRNTLAFQQYHERMVHYDQVTGLPGEQLFERAVDELLAAPARPEHIGTLLALFSITVPECRTLRESISKPTADALAAEVAKRLTRLVEESRPALGVDAADRRPRVARLGEQHFALAIEGLRGAEAVESMAKRVLAKLSEPVSLAGHEVVPAPWLGVAVAPNDGQKCVTLRQCADLAASQRGNGGNAPITFASPELNARSLRRLTLGAELRSAAQRDQLRLRYQPKVDLATGRINGAEALVRWQHPGRGMIGPMEFIPLAEELGLMAGIGEWVLDRACRDAVAWAQAGLGELKVAVNVSKVQVAAGDLGRVVRQAMFDSGLPAHRLVIELTESMLMDDVSQALLLMHELKGLGVTLSIDDFGTGYSSLAYLKKFPLDELKIDRSFIMDLPGDPVDLALVRTVVELGHSLNMTVTAEGVETSWQRDCLREMGCNTGQGYLFGRPVPDRELRALLLHLAQMDASSAPEHAVRGAARAGLKVPGPVPGLALRDPAG